MGTPTNLTLTATFVTPLRVYATYKSGKTTLLLTARAIPVSVTDLLAHVLTAEVSAVYLTVPNTYVLIVAATVLERIASV